MQLVKRKFNQDEEDSQEDSEEDAGQPKRRRLDPREGIKQRKEVVWLETFFLEEAQGIGQLLPVVDVVRIVLSYFVTCVPAHRLSKPCTSHYVCPFCKKDQCSERFIQCTITSQPPCIQKIHLGCDASPWTCDSCRVCPNHEGEPRYISMVCTACPIRCKRCVTICPKCKRLLCIACRRDCKKLCVECNTSCLEIFMSCANCDRRLCYECYHDCVASGADRIDRGCSACIPICTDCDCRHCVKCTCADATDDSSLARSNIWRFPA
jgi:hypothetical protein